MNELVKQANDVTIFADGSAFIGQRKLAALCGVDQSTISRFSASRNFDVNQGISAENARVCITHYAIESKSSNDTARKTLAMIAEAGMKAYLYHEAGYEMSAGVPKQMTDMQMIIASAQAIEKLRETQAEQQRQITAIQSKVAMLAGESDYVAILAWATLNGLNIPTSKASGMGKKAAEHCRLKNIEIGFVHDERYGKIGTYPKTVLDLLFKPGT